MRAFFPVLAAAFAALAAPAAAQSVERQWELCTNEQLQTPPAEALGACTALIDTSGLSDQDRARAYNLRAISYYDLEDYRRALADYDRAIALSPEAWFHYNRGNAHLALDDRERALADYEEAIRLDPEYADGYSGRANVHEDRGDFARAVEDSRQAQALMPDNPDILNSLCWHLGLADRSLSEAQASCDRSLELRPNDAATLDSRGLIGLRQRRYDNAWRDYDAAVRADATLASPRYGRGIAALRLGRGEEGRADLAAAAALDAEIAATYARFGIRP